MSKNLLENYCNKIDELAPATFNEDQKILAKKILEKADEKDLQNIFQMLIQRIKIGFTFDVAPTYQKEDEQSVALLKKDENRSFKNYENTSNIENTLIIGENYDALKNLLVIERERESSSRSDAYYDVIYIDPPYNTESAKDDGNHLVDEKSNIAPSKFVYRDKFSRNGWLNMLNERLRLAKQLLKDDGVIFVSIDDNEQAYLKILMDEIFGEENFVVNFVWEKTSHSNQGNTGKKIFKNAEYILCYSKNFDNVNEINEGTKTSFDSAPLKNNSNLEHTITFEPNQIYIKEDNKFNIDQMKFSIKSRWSQDRINLEITKGTKFVLTNKKNSTIRVKYSTNKIGYNIPKALLNTSYLYTNNEYNKSTTEHGTKLLFSIIDKDIVLINGKPIYPKPLELIKYLLYIMQNKNLRVLDFYAGSGTTGHAVMELNKEDNGNRTYTLVTNNENNIGYDICYERLYRVNNGLGTNSETFEWIKKNNPYKQNLNIFSIDYYDTSILKKDDNDSIAKIKKALNKEIEEFGIMPSSNFNVDIYYDLLSLKPIIKESK